MPRLTIEKTTEKLVTIRHAGHTWKITADDTTAFLIVHRQPNGFKTTEICSTVETERFFLAILAKRLQLSDFWNGQRYITSVEVPKPTNKSSHV